MQCKKNYVQMANVATYTSSEPKSAIITSFSFEKDMETEFLLQNSHRAWKFTSVCSRLVSRTQAYTEITTGV
jgi:hypothetical protein